MVKCSRRIEARACIRACTWALCTSRERRQTLYKKYLYRSNNYELILNLIVVQFFLHFMQRNMQLSSRFDYNWIYHVEWPSFYGRSIAKRSLSCEIFLHYSRSICDNSIDILFYIVNAILEKIILEKIGISYKSLKKFSESNNLKKWATLWLNDWPYGSLKSRWPVACIHQCFWIRCNIFGQLPVEKLGRFVLGSLELIVFFSHHFKLVLQTVR